MQTSNENSKVRLNAKPGLARNCLNVDGILKEKKLKVHLKKIHFFRLETLIHKTCSTYICAKKKELRVG